MSDYICIFVLLLVGWGVFKNIAKRIVPPAHHGTDDRPGGYND